MSITSVPVNKVPTVPAEEWEVWASEHDAVLLDVREEAEWGLGTLPGATLIAMSELVARIDELPKNRSILCVCRSGARSHQVAAYLLHIGFEDVANMAGGMKALGMQD